MQPDTLRRGRVLALALLCTLLAPASAFASCRIIGDCIGQGVGWVLKGCTNDGHMGWQVQAIARQVDGRDLDYLIVSAGSNNFPASLPAGQRAAQTTAVFNALDRIHAGKGRATMLVILPANGARGAVADWAASRGVETFDFAAGGDGVHPRAYGPLAAKLLARMRQGS